MSENALRLCDLAKRIVLSTNFENWFVERCDRYKVYSIDVKTAVDGLSLFNFITNNSDIEEILSNKHLKSIIESGRRYSVSIYKDKCGKRHNYLSLKTDRYLTIEERTEETELKFKFLKDNLHRLRVSKHSSTKFNFSIQRDRINDIQLRENDVSDTLLSIPDLVKANGAIRDNVAVMMDQIACDEAIAATKELQKITKEDLISSNFQIDINHEFDLLQEASPIMTRAIKSFIIPLRTHSKNIVKYDKNKQFDLVSLLESMLNVRTNNSLCTPIKSAVSMLATIRDVPNSIFELLNSQHSLQIKWKNPKIRNSLVNTVDCNNRERISDWADLKNPILHIFDNLNSKVFKQIQSSSDKLCNVTDTITHLVYLMENPSLDISFPSAVNVPINFDKLYACIQLYLRDPSYAIDMSIISSVTDHSNNVRLHDFIPLKSETGRSSSFTVFKSKVIDAIDSLQNSYASRTTKYVLFDLEFSQHLLKMTETNQNLVSSIAFFPDTWHCRKHLIECLFKLPDEFSIIFAPFFANCIQFRYSTYKKFCHPSINMSNFQIESQCDILNSIQLLSSICNNETALIDTYEDIENDIDVVSDRDEIDADIDDMSDSEDDSNYDNDDNEEKNARTPSITVVIPDTKSTVKHKRLKKAGQVSCIRHSSRIHSIKALDDSMIPFDEIDLDSGQIKSVSKKTSATRQINIYNDAPSSSNVFISYSRLQSYIDLFYIAWKEVKPDILERVGKSDTKSNLTNFLFQFFENELSLCVQPFESWWENGDTTSFWQNLVRMIGFVSYCNRPKITRHMLHLLHNMLHHVENRPDVMQLLQLNSKHIVEVYIEYANLIVSQQLSNHTGLRTENEVQNASILGFMSNEIVKQLHHARGDIPHLNRTFQFAFQSMTPIMIKVKHCIKSYIKHLFHLSLNDPVAARIEVSSKVKWENGLNEKVVGPNGYFWKLKEFIFSLRTLKRKKKRRGIQIAKKKSKV